MGVTEWILGHWGQFQRGRQKGWLPDLAPLPGGPAPRARVEKSPREHTFHHMGELGTGRGVCSRSTGSHRRPLSSHRGLAGRSYPTSHPGETSLFLLSLQDAGGQEPPCSGSSPLTSSPLGPALQVGWAAGPGPSLPLGTSCLKCLTFLSNFLFSLLGLLALAIGLWGLAVKGSLGSSWGGPLPADPMLGLLLVGLAVSAVSLAGCLGALCENTFLLRCFSGGLLAFLVLEAVAGALVVALWGPLQDGLEHALRLAITRYQDDPDLHFLVDQVQLGLRCCGAASYQDWQHNL